MTFLPPTDQWVWWQWLSLGLTAVIAVCFGSAMEWSTTQKLDSKKEVLVYGVITFILLLVTLVVALTTELWLLLILLHIALFVTILMLTIHLLPVWMDKYDESPPEDQFILDAPIREIE